MLESLEFCHAFPALQDQGAPVIGGSFEADHMIQFNVERWPSQRSSHITGLVNKTQR